ncbi:MAG: DUF1640 domain-containing protein [Desulfovibrio sp.]|nr:DUF1640 domain-containing protein [Desulfovibrio sp.]
MALVAFDTLAYSNRLEQNGFTREQAEAIAHANAEAMRDMLAAQEFVTKKDLLETQVALENRIAGAKDEQRKEIGASNAESRKEMAANTAELRKEIQDTRDELQKEIHDTKDELRKELEVIRVYIADTKHELLKWTIGMGMSAIGLIVAAIGIGITLFRPG